MEISQQKYLNVVLCQTHPQLKKKQLNIQKFDHQIQFLRQQDNIDIIIFPQMSFTGYNFKNNQDALSQAVFFGQGLQFEYARHLSLLLQAYVLFGYIQKAEKNGRVVLYNSAAICNRQGQFIFNTRKTHLYFADQLWSQEGDGFKQLTIRNRKGQTFRCAVGICMDINQKHFQSGKKEFADFIKSKDSEVILFPTNWIDRDRSDENSAEQIYNYWLNRLGPLLKPHSTKKRLLLVANRVGREYSFYDKQYCWFMGSSCAISVNPHIVIEKLDKEKQSYLKIQVCLPLN